ncbi:hypothetical protein CBL_12316 [Carabus blaptoides fortunei]
MDLMDFMGMSNKQMQITAETIKGSIDIHKDFTRRGRHWPAPLLKTGSDSGGINCMNQSKKRSSGSQPAAPLPPPGVWRSAHVISVRDFIQHVHTRINTLPSRIRVSRGARRDQREVQCPEPHIQTKKGLRKPDIVARRKQKGTILDVQVVSGAKPLSKLHQDKAAKYQDPDVLHQSRSSVDDISHGLLRDNVNVTLLQEPYLSQESDRGLPPAMRVYATGMKRANAAIIINDDILDVLVYPEHCDQYGFSQPALSLIVKRVVEAIAAHRERFIKFPESEEETTPRKNSTILASRQSTYK